MEIADGLGSARLPRDRDGVVLRRDGEVRRGGRLRRQELRIHEGLRHLRLVQQRSRHRGDFVRFDHPVTVDVGLGAPAGHALDRAHVCRIECDGIAAEGNAGFQLARVGNTDIRLHGVERRRKR